jgi:hypothetical protein
VALDDEGVVEELHLEVVFSDAREVDEDLESRGRLVGVGGGPPARMREHA